LTFHPYQSAGFLLVALPTPTVGVYEVVEMISKFSIVIFIHLLDLGYNQEQLQKMELHNYNARWLVRFLRGDL
jgi:hypothetical protein